MKRLSFVIFCFLFCMVFLTLTTSCLEDKDSYRAGFVFNKPAKPIQRIYANNVVDSIVLYSHGNWNAYFPDAKPDWCTSDLMEGHGQTIYSIPVRFSQNTTDKSRMATLTFIDKNHPNDAHATLYFEQYATRGDGTMGSAADVKTITGSDGSRYEFAYDVQHRPTSLRITKDDVTLHSISLSYSEYDSTLTVTNMSTTMSARYGNDYQPLLLVGASDTVGYYSQYYSNYMEVSANYAFNIEHHRYGQPTKRYALLLNGQSLMPDSLHNVDSLRIATDHMLENLKLKYSQTDNRRQSVDVNQLIFGTEQCDPYQLLSLFRFARNTSIISEATGKVEDDRIVVSTSLNADLSVSTLTVTRKGQQVVYTFGY